MSENPEDWRSAVDAASGRTYWYHRKTRVSTWVKPDFFDAENAVPQPPARSNSQDIKRDTMPSKVQSFRSLFSKTLEVIARDPGSATQAQLSTLFEHLQLMQTAEHAEAESSISGLVHLVMLSCGERCNANTVSVRRAALKCLWWLSSAMERSYVAEHFYSDQSWTSLFQQTSRWKPNSGNSPQGDVESLLLLGAIVSNLTIGPTALLINSACASELAASIEAVRDSNSSSAQAIDALAAWPGVLCDRTLQVFAVLAQKGHRLPATWLVTVFSHSLRVERDFVLVVQAGGLQALQSICTSHRAEQTVRSAAREALLNAMAGSAYAREKVLDGLLGLGTDLASVPVPMGPDPVLYAHQPAARSDPGKADDGQDSDEEHVHGGADEDGDEEGGMEQESAAQARYRQLVASEHFEVLEVAPARLDGDTDEGEEGDVWNAFQRDVEWIPKAGTPWRLSSVILWARCPALRDLISGFWEEGGGGLELSIDASDETLASLCRYMHTGLLVLPLRTSRQLQLLRVASELGMQRLYEAASEQVQSRLTLDNVAAVVNFSAEHGFEELERAGRAFLANDGSGVPPSIRLQVATEAQLPRSGSASASLLRDAVASSIQDVNAVLGQQAVPTAKLKVEPVTGPARSLLGALTAASSQLPATAGPSLAHLQQFDPPSRGSSLQQFTSHPDSSFLRELDEQPDEPADPYELSQLSLLDIASSDTAALRGRTSYGMSAPSMYQTYVETDYTDSSMYFDTSTTPRSAPVGGRAGSAGAAGGAAGGGKAAASSKGKTGKAKGSGGIYGLLLQSGMKEDSGYGEELQRSTGGIVPKRAGQVPGRVVGEAGKQLNPKTGAGAKPTASGVPDSTPRTQRAASLLAAARPSGTSSYTDSYFPEQDDYESAGSHEDPQQTGSRQSTNSHAASSAGPQEFVRQMSLAPPKPLTPNEKRLERLSRPTKTLALVSGSKETPSDGADGAPDQPEAENHPAASADPVIPARAGASEEVNGARQSTGRATGAPVRKGPSQTRAGSSVRDSADATSASASSLPSSIVALKRSVSPSTASQASRDGHLVSLGSLPAGVSGSGTQSPPPRSEVNVRGSLTLLKTKTANRRRRSVADIEGAQEGSAVDAAGGVVSSADFGAEPPSTPHLPAPARSGPGLRAAPPPRVALDLTSYLGTDGAEVDQDNDDVPEGPNSRYDDAAPRGLTTMVPCPHCGRQFNPESCQRHVKICEKVFLRKRKAFDSAKMRIEGNPDLKEFVEHGGGESGSTTGKAVLKKTASKSALERKTSQKDQQGPAQSAAAKWKHQSEAFRAAMRSARETSAAVASGAPLPPPPASVPDPSLKQCPHCSRRFSQQAAERHIPVCQSIRAKPASLKRGGGTNASTGGGVVGNPSGKMNRGWQ